MSIHLLLLGSFHGLEMEKLGGVRLGIMVDFFLIYMPFWIEKFT
jgi:hypothetical protein